MEIPKVAIMQPANPSKFAAKAIIATILFCIVAGVTSCAGVGKPSLNELGEKWASVTAAEAQAMIDAGADVNATYGGNGY